MRNKMTSEGASGGKRTAEVPVRMISFVVFGTIERVGPGNQADDMDNRVVDVLDTDGCPNVVQSLVTVEPSPVSRMR